MNEIKRASCPHGVEYGRGGFGRMNAGKPVLWNGGIAHCECCVSNYGYIDSYKVTYKDGKVESSGHVEPKDRCHDCR